MRRWTPTAAAALTIVIAAAHAEDGIVRLHAAGSLKPALTEVAHGFTVAYGIRIDPVWGPSGLLREGFERGEAGCPMCAGVHRQEGSPGQRIVSTTNRNFAGRQGPGVMTHLASPATAAAAALAGCITDRRAVA